MLKSHMCSTKSLLTISTSCTIGIRKHGWSPILNTYWFFLCLQPFVLNYLPYTFLLVVFPQINNINTFYEKGAWRHWNSHTMLHCKHQQSCNNKSLIMVNHNISMFTFLCIKFLIKFYRFCILFFSFCRILSPTTFFLAIITNILQFFLALF